MPAEPKRTSVRGSEKALLAGARAVGAVSDRERFEVTLRIRAKSPIGESQDKGVSEDVLPQKRRYLSREELAELHGSDPGDVEKVVRFAKEHGLRVVESDAGRRSVTLSGTAAAFGAAFGSPLQRYEHPGGTFRGRVGELSVPDDVHDIIEGVFGLDDRPQCRPHYQYRVLSGASEAAHSSSFTPIQVAALYGFPAQLDGSGQTIGIIELGGGFRKADLKTYFSKLGLPVPQVKAVSVDGGRNTPSTADGADGEVMLDIEVAGAVAPKAKLVVYFAPNTDRGFLDAITKAVHDTVNKPSVISISWGGPESSWTSQSMAQYDQAFRAAAAVGVTVCVASGDNGSTDGVSDGRAHVDFPASSPHVLGCGGTKLVGAGSSISAEVVWNDGPNSATGGGMSLAFPRPSYQSRIQVPGAAKSARGVPDVAGNADPATGYQVRVDGKDFVIGGTSAVAPLWAGLIALFNQRLKAPVGFLNPLIYGSCAGKGVFRDVASGSNGAYSAAPGWDACTGWGSPVGKSLLTALGG